VGYFSEIYHVGKSILVGMGITFRYLRKPSTIVTIQYPREREKLPPRHRGIHFLETEKCIMCFICAKACPVDCIWIEGSRDGAVDGSFQGDKAWITKFTIDYGLCIYCNLCCEPCPKDCIHMGQEFDFAGYTRLSMEKNLLTGKPYTDEDQATVLQTRGAITKLEAEVKAKKAAEAAAKKAAAAAAKPAAPPAAGAVSPSAPPAAAAPAPKPAAAPPSPPKPGEKPA
jgi:NADH-quinone oxidoreductase subunit I